MVYNANSLRPLDECTDEKPAVRIRHCGCELPDLDLSPKISSMFRFIPGTEQPNGFNMLHAIIFYGREKWNYLMNVFLTMFILNLCQAFVWAVHWRNIGERLSLDLTLLLVAVAFKQVSAVTRIEERRSEECRRMDVRCRPQ